MPNDVTPDPATVARPLVRALMTHRADLTTYVQRQMPAALRGSVDPADVVQDVCYEALRREATFAPADDDAGRRWLFTVARHRIIRLAERQRASRRAPAGEAGNEDPDDALALLLEDLAVYQRTPSQSAASHETWAAVTRSIDRLAPDHAAVIRSRYFDGQPAADVAQRSGRTLASVNQLLYRAMSALRSDLRSLIVAHA